MNEILEILGIFIAGFIVGGFVEYFFNMKRLYKRGLFDKEGRLYNYKIKRFQNDR